MHGKRYRLIKPISTGCFGSIFPGKNVIVTELKWADYIFKEKTKMYKIQDGLNNPSFFAFTLTDLKIFTEEIKADLSCYKCAYIELCIHIRTDLEKCFCFDSSGKNQIEKNSIWSPLFEKRDFDECS